MNLKLISFLLASMAAIAGLTAGVGFVTLQKWLTPIEPVIYLAAVLILAFAVLAGLWFVVTKREIESGIGSEGVSAEERALRRLVMITSQVILAVFAVGLAGLWNLGEVRARFVPFIGDTAVALEQPLRDPSPKVKGAACAEIFRRGWVFRSKGPLISALDPHPDVAQQCLKEASDNGWKGADLLAAELGSGWEAALIAATPANAPQMCAIVPWLAGVDQIAKEDSDYRLLRCTTQSSSDDVRVCCASALSQKGKIAATFGEPEDFGARIDGEILGSLVKYSFRPLSLSPQQQQVATTLQTDNEPTRRWIAEVGCAMLDPTENQVELINGMFPLVESRACGLTGDQQIEYGHAQSWVRLCGLIAASDPAKPIEATVCESVLAARQQKAIEQARLHVWEAIRAPFLEKDAQFVTEGVVRAEIRLGSGGGGAREAEAKQRRLDDLMNTTTADLAWGSDRRQIDRTTCQRTAWDLAPGRTPNAKDMQKTEWTYDCDGMYDDRTFGEILKSRNRTIRDIASGKKMSEMGREETSERGKRRAQQAFDELTPEKTR